MNRAIRIAWAAGFLDGEGHFGAVWCNEATGAVRVQISVTQVDRRPLDELVRLFGGTIAPQHKASEFRQATWQWRVTSAPGVASIIDEIRDNLIVKREQAQTLRKICATTIGRKRNARIQPMLKSRRRLLLKKLVEHRRAVL
jgi:hypothetical protein